MTKPAPWPPPPTPHDRYARAPVRDGGRHQMLRLRVVLLWGNWVLVDVAGRVYCDGCGSLVDAVELGRLDNAHRVGLPFRAAGQSVPPRAHLATEDLGPLYAGINAALNDGCSIGQAVRATGCTEADVRAVKATRDRRQMPPPRPQPGW